MCLSIIICRPGWVKVNSMYVFLMLNSTCGKILKAKIEELALRGNKRDFSVFFFFYKKNHIGRFINHDVL